MSTPDHVPSPSSSLPLSAGATTPQPAGHPFAPLAPSRSLSATLAERLARDIADATLAPGSRLPTELQLCASLGVSRTVVREAMAALRRDGLVVARQGVGVFVAEPDQRRPFRIDPQALESVTNMLMLMELRTGLESEAAALAALRREAEDLRHLDAALAAQEAGAQDPAAASEADVAFHRAVLQATRNAYFIDFHRYLGQFVMPGQSVRAMAVPPAERAKYLRRVRQEHQAIRDAIAAHDEAGARKAALLHLRNSRKRFGRLRETLQSQTANIQ